MINVEQARSIATVSLLSSTENIQAKIYQNASIGRNYVYFDTNGLSKSDKKTLIRSMKKKGFRVRKLFRTRLIRIRW